MARVVKRNIGPKDNPKEPAYSLTTCPFCLQKLPESSFRELLALGNFRSIPCPTQSCSAYVYLKPSRYGNEANFSLKTLL